MTEQDALDLVRRLLKAPNEVELMRLVQQHLAELDGTFFATAEAAATQLTLEGKESVAVSLRALTDRMLRMKTLI